MYKKCLLNTILVIISFLIFQNPAIAQFNFLAAPPDGEVEKHICVEGQPQCAGDADCPAQSKCNKDGCCEMPAPDPCAEDPNNCAPKPDLCGNEQTDPGEECDRIPLSNYCKTKEGKDGECGAKDTPTACKCTPLCGNGMTDFGEECDGDGQQCQNKNGNGICHECKCTICGDGKVEGDEQCDIKNNTSNGSNQACPPLTDQGYKVKQICDKCKCRLITKAEQCKNASRMVCEACVKNCSSPLNNKTSFEDSMKDCIKNSKNCAHCTRNKNNLPLCIQCFKYISPTHLKSAEKFCKQNTHLYK